MVTQRYTLPQVVSEMCVDRKTANDCFPPDPALPL